MLYGLNVSYDMKRDKREEFLAEVTGSGLLDAIRQEEGCLQYDYYVPAPDRDHLLLVEVWTQKAAQQRHMSHPNMSRLQPLVDRCADRMTLLTYDIEE